MSSNPPNYPNYSSNQPDYPNYSKDDQKRQNMQSSNPTDNQNYSAYSNPPPSAPQPYPPPQQPYPPPQQPYQPQPPPSAAPPYDGQPVSGIPVYGSSASLRPWSTGLFGCHEDMCNCLITCCCPCVTFGQIAEIVDKGATSCAHSAIVYALIMHFTTCPCLYSCFYRSKLRNQFALEESPCADSCAHIFCEQCALCQEYRELKNQGFDMAIGWEGNVEKKRREMTMAPMAHGGMTR